MGRKNYFLVLLLSFLLIFGAGGCQPEDSASQLTEADEQPVAQVVNLGPQEAARLLDEQQEIQVLDLRTPAEYYSGYLPEAQLVPLDHPYFWQIIEEYFTATPLLIYCRTGNRTGNVVEQIAQLTDYPVYHLDSGIVDWQGAGKPLFY